MPPIQSPPKTVCSILTPCGPSQGESSFPANRRRRDSHADAGGIVGSHVPQSTHNLLRLSMDTAALLDRFTHRCLVCEHPGESYRFRRWLKIRLSKTSSRRRITKTIRIKWGLG